MKYTFLLSTAICLFISSFSLADTFAEETPNEFDIDFVPIAGDAGDLGDWSAGDGYTFSGVNHGDYRIGKFEITNAQWEKFKANIAPMLVTGTPSSAYIAEPAYTGVNVPTNRVSWYEAAQFVNWLNTNTGHQAAYKFTGTQGTSDYKLGVWDAADAWGGTNLYRHKDAYYFLPTEDEWVKAAYWNGMNLQTWATVEDVAPTQDGWNFYDGGWATDPYGPWDVGSGSEEINGTYDMMGNVSEWMESPYYSEDSGPSHYRGVRGSSFSYDNIYHLGSSFRVFYPRSSEDGGLGFRIASIPEPATLLLLGIGAVMMRRRK